MTKFVTFGVRFCLQRIAGTTFQHLWVILNLLEGCSEQLRRCVPGGASDTCLYPKPRWFSIDQATKSSHISQTVSHLGENFSSCPVPAFVEFKDVLPTGNNRSQSQYFVCRLLTAGTAIKLPALPTQPAQLLQANATFLTVKLNTCMPGSYTKKKYY